jgi:hypothetical protein
LIWGRLNIPIWLNWNFKWIKYCNKHVTQGAFQKHIGEIIISLLMKFQDDQRCVMKCQFHKSFQFLHPMLLCWTHSLLKLKPKIDLYISMFCPNKFFQSSLFVWLHFSILNFTFGCSFNFQILINVIGNYENYTKNGGFYFGALVLHKKSTLIIYQMVIKLGISKPTFMHNIRMLSTK